VWWFELATMQRTAAAPPKTQFEYFAVAAPGLEALLQRELSALGVQGQAVEGGVEGRADTTGLWAIHLQSALAESVRVRLKPFVARDFHALEVNLGRLPWHAYLRRGAAVRIDVTCHRSRLFHSDAVAERLGRVLVGRFFSKLASEPQGDEDGGEPTQRVFLRIVNDTVSASVDASGARLHKRGYRTFVEQAPLRETLAAAMVELLLQLGPGTPQVWDPFCGSGVLPIEWARKKQGALPGAERSFAFEQWPIHVEQAWQQFRAERSRGELARGSDPILASPAPSPLGWGSDLKAKALRSCRANAERAHVSEQTAWLGGDFRTHTSQIPRGVGVLTNPPYGVRLGSQEQAGKLFAALEEVLRQRRDLRPAVVACADRRLLTGSGLPWRVLTQTRNGGVGLSFIGLV
jgi:putative N6-adenine-specific DNA methylase